MKKILFSALSFVLLATSCSKDNLENAAQIEGDPNKYSIIATMVDEAEAENSKSTKSIQEDGWIASSLVSSVETRITVETDGVTKWVMADKAHFLVGSAATTVSEFTVSSVADGGKTATFTSPVSEMGSQKLYGIHPATGTFDGTTRVYTLAPITMQDNTLTQIAMLAYPTNVNISSGGTSDEVRFTHLYSALGIQLQLPAGVSGKVTTVEIKNALGATEDQRIATTVGRTVNLKAEESGMDFRTLTPVDNEEAKSIMITPSGGIDVAAGGTFNVFAKIYPVDLTDMDIVFIVTLESGKMFQVTKKGTHFVRGSFLSFKSETQTSKLSETLAIKWEYDTRCGFKKASPAVSPNGNIVIGEDANGSRGAENISLISPAGQLIGAYQAPNVVRSSAAFADNGKYYIGSYDNKFYAFDADSPTSPRITFEGVSPNDGHVKYNAPAIDTDGTIYSPHDGILYSFTDDGSSSTFTKKWEFALGTNDIYSAPIIDATNVYIVASNGRMFAINKSTGTQLWTKQFGTGTSDAPAFGVDGTIYLSGNNYDDGYVMAINPTDGDIKWQVNITGEKFDQGGISLSIDGHLYVGNKAGKMVCYKQDDGAKMWEFTTRDEKEIRAVSAIDNDGNIYFGDMGGNFYFLNANGDPRRKEIKLGSKIWSSPAIGKDGTIYICVDQAENESNEKASKLFALTTTATGAMDSWSMAGGNAQRNGRKQ